MSRGRASGADFSVTSPVGLAILRRRPASGGTGTPAPEGMRQLTPEEKAINEVWTWDTELATWVSPPHPEGIRR